MSDDANDLASVLHRHLDGAKMVEKVRWEDLAGWCEAADELDARLAVAERDRDAALADAARLRERLHTVEKHERELSNALDFYADEGNYDFEFIGGGVFRRRRYVLVDHGTRARAALAATEPAPDA